MKPLTVADAPLAVLALQEEILRSDESRYDHRLHGVLLVAQGMSCRQAALVLGDAPRTVEYWVRDYGSRGLAGLHEKERTGRPPRLIAEQLNIIGRTLRRPPEAAGISANLWDGKALAAFVVRKFSVSLGVRQCQRLFRSLGFRLRKPRPEITHADPELQRAHKKTPGDGGRSWGGTLGSGRSPLPAARIQMPNVGSSGGARSGFTASPYPQAGRLLRRRPPVGWQIPLPVGGRTVQCSNVLGVIEVPPPGLPQ